MEQEFRLVVGEAKWWERLAINSTRRSLPRSRLNWERKKVGWYVVNGVHGVNGFGTGISSMFSRSDLRVSRVVLNANKTRLM